MLSDPDIGYDIYHVMSLVIRSSVILIEQLLSASVVDLIVL